MRLGGNAMVIRLKDTAKLFGMDSIISFTSDYSKIWIETSATISFTYSVKDPAEVQKGLAAFLGNNS